MPLGTQHGEITLAHSGCSSPSVSGSGSLQCDQETFNLFTEMLIEWGQTSKNIKTICIWTGYNLYSVNDDGWKRNIQSLDRTLRTQPKLPNSFSIEHLVRLVRFFGNKIEWIGLKVFVLFAYFSLLRLSNLVPRTFKAIDKSRNTLLNDIVKTKFGLAILLKWGKTQQGNNQLNIVPLTKIKNSILCPYKAFLTYQTYSRNFVKMEIIYSYPAMAQSRK